MFEDINGLKFDVGALVMRPNDNYLYEVCWLELDSDTVLVLYNFSLNSYVVATEKMLSECEVQ